jgi:hypothetical protein
MNMIPVTKGFKLLRGIPKEGQCPECAAMHPPESAHNQQSLHWQYYFYEKFNRWPTWEDAIAHCKPDIRKKWRVALAEHGVIVTATSPPIPPPPIPPK